MLGINEGTLSRSYHMRERFCNNRLSHIKSMSMEPNNLELEIKKS
jgi:hypothetical protein